MADFSIPAVSFEHPHTTELIIKRSRFLAQAVHAPSLNQGRAFVESLRLKYPEANHHCWACLGGVPGDTGQAAASDDGEPHGTAGKPMLQILLHSEIGEICVVVTRWFGGIKLGTGGLVRAYQDSVRQNLESLPLKAKRVLVQLGFIISYQEQSKVERLIKAMSGDILQLDYSSHVAMEVALDQEKQETFVQQLQDITNGRIQVKLI
ncbi:MAG: YigZ family protein [Desulfovibrionaceae bacterium]|nr:YigZ family protein [Desulfovibrionaceae bacterium]